MSSPLRLVALVVAGLVLLFASPAFAQDYTITEVSGKYVERSGAGNTYSLADDAFASVDLPFDFFFYGRTWDKAYIHSNGFAQFKESAPSRSLYTNTTFGGFSGDSDGMVAPLWDDLDPANAGTSSVVATFTTGTAPNRTFIFSWETMERFSGAGNYWFQVQLHEGNGRITFAYKDENNPSTWTNLDYSVGIEEPDRASTAKTRFVSPNTASNQSSHPGTDYQFDPAVTRYTGRVLADFPVADESGIGNSVLLSQPVSGVEVELLDGSGGVAAAGTTDEDGDFEVRGLALDSSSTGSLRVSSAAPACNVGRTAAGPETFQLSSSVTFGADTAIGTITITDLNDADAAFRAPLFIARHVQALADRYGTLTDPPVRPLTVLYDTTSSPATGYTPRNGLDPAVLRIGSAASGNEDAWDRSIATRGWARVFLDSLTGFAGNTPTHGLDVVSNTGNAFAEGFGAFLHAHFTGESTLVDATGASTAVTFDIETPELTNAEADDVAGWVAAALWDLHDGISDEEPTDQIDGSGDADRIFAVLDEIIGEATPDAFTGAWNDLGHDTVTQVQLFILHGLYPDDDSEENDTLETAASLGVVGNVIANRVLNRFNEDWFVATLPQASEGIQVIMAFDRFNVITEASLEIRNATTGALIATGTADSTTDPYVARTGPLGPGAYAIGIAHLNGDRVADYSLTTFAQLGVGDFSMPDWTVDQPYLVDVPITGGVPPYTIAVDSSFELPPGLTLDGANTRIRGTPTQAGDFSFLLDIRDSAVPPNEVSTAQELTINPEFVLGGAPMLGLPLGVESTIELQRSGGTAPFGVQLGDGTLPAGITLGATTPDVLGTAAEFGSALVRIDVADAAGAQQTLTTTLVACAAVPEKNTAAPLGAGAAATGYWLDALAGSDLTLKVKTAKKRAKRLLDAIVVDANGNRVEGGKIKGGKGKAQFKKVVVPATGRYFLILSSDTGDATELTASAKVKAPKSLKGVIEDFSSSDVEQIEFGALAGAQLAFQAKTDRSGLLVDVQALVSPSGKVVFGPRLDLQVKKTSIKFNRELDESGTWRIVLVHDSGPAGSGKYKLKVKQPKGVEFSLE